MILNDTKNCLTLNPQGFSLRKVQMAVSVDVAHQKATQT